MAQFWAGLKSRFLLKTQVANNLCTTESGYALDARQATVLRTSARAHNLLDNSDFRAPVNQRGQATYATPWGMTLDRWYLCDSRGGGEEAQTLQIVPGVGVRISGNHPNIVQRIPLLDDDKVYTAACLCADGTLLCQTFSGSALNYRDFGFAQVMLVDRPATLVWAALYEGAYTADELPPYLPRGYAAEWAECRRYYRRYAGDILIAFYPNAVAMLTANASGMYGTGVPQVSVGALTRTATAETLTPTGHTVVGRDAIWIGLNLTLTLGEGCYATDITLSTEL